MSLRGAASRRRGNLLVDQEIASGKERRARNDNNIYNKEKLSHGKKEQA